MMTYYMAVTSDKYELPLYVSESASDLAMKFGLNPNTVLSAIALNKNGNRSGRKFIKIEVDERESDESE